MFAVFCVVTLCILVDTRMCLQFQAYLKMDSAECGSILSGTLQESDARPICFLSTTYERLILLATC